MTYKARAAPHTSQASQAGFALTTVQTWQVQDDGASAGCAFSATGATSLISEASKLAEGWVEEEEEEVEAGGGADGII